MASYIMVSIIIPVYNVENYEAACLESVIRQTEQDLEILVINDGSTDRSGAICEEYAAQDPRIRYIKTENQGLSDARNLGLKLCTGDYISFVDSDDRLHPQAIEFMLKAMREYGSSVVRTGFKRISEQAKPEFRKFDYDTLPIVVQDCFTEIKNSFSTEILRVVWGGLYTRECIKDLAFESGKYHEDVMFTYQVLDRAKKMVRIEAPLYQYRSRSGSIVHQKKAGKIDVDRLDVGLQIIEFVSENCSELLDEAGAELLTSCANKQIRIWDYGCDSEYEDILKQRIKEARSVAKPRFRMLWNKDIPLPRRFLCLGCMISFKATCRLKQLALTVINR